MRHLFFEEYILRLCLIIGIAEFDDIILCQITSRSYGSRRVVSLKNEDFQTGSIAVDSYIRPDKIVTLDMESISKKLGDLNKEKLSEAKVELKRVFEIC